MATPVPPPSPRHLRLLRLLLSGLILGAALNGATARRPDATTCPGSLDCALKRRAKCPPGAHACGPCLQSFQEDQRGFCVPRKHQSSGEGLSQPRLEEEIDSLAQELALKEKEAGHSKLTAQPLLEAAQKLLEPATLELSQWGQRLEPSLPSTHGTPSPTPHTSLSSRASSGPVQMSPLEPQGRHGNGLTLVLILAFCLASTAALAVAALCWCRLQREIRLTQKADYTATAKGPASPTTPRISPGDQRLAHSAEMYHYQHQRQQMLCLERVYRGPSHFAPTRHKEPPKELESASSDEENEDGDFTVYECPGLAPTGEMEVRNPLFDHSTLSAPVPGLHSSQPLQ
ncbi:neural proliferation differentiation and control protein 1 isoform X2 [Grammomys surdaster]|uniref:neural proliferation differentiation and control protein 1 isoform X2 n=1 Tax=Grammomys surdaster TaxID=491861 RepID=UPI00109F1B25|nr:neural proliferation differentiation and control protein 1 isoform X2 [Grammomys surdaster]